jgi:hypothetical protein
MKRSQEEEVVMIAPTDTPTHAASDEQHTVLSTDEARQGVTGHHVRYVLGLGLVGVVVLFVAIYAFYFGT